MSCHSGRTNCLVQFRLCVVGIFSSCAKQRVEQVTLLVKLCLVVYVPCYWQWKCKLLNKFSCCMVTLGGIINIYWTKIGATYRYLSVASRSERSFNISEQKMQMLPQTRPWFCHEPDVRLCHFLIVGLLTNQLALLLPVHGKQSSVKCLGFTAGNSFSPHVPPLFFTPLVGSSLAPCIFDLSTWKRKGNVSYTNYKLCSCNYYHVKIKIFMFMFNKISFQ